MVRVDIYSPKDWKPEKATYKLGSAVIASTLSAVLLFFLALQGVAAAPPNYGLALSAILLVLIGLFAAFTRPRFDELYRVAPRPPLMKHPMATLTIAAFVYLGIGLLNRIVVAQELSLLSQDSINQQIGILAGSGVSENLLVGYLLFSILFAALILTTGNYWFAGATALVVSSGAAWINHYFVYGLDPRYFIFVFGSFLGMNALYWLTGSIMLTIIIHVWWNIGALVWQTLSLPTIAIPGLGCLPYCTISAIQPLLGALPLISGLPILFVLLILSLKNRYSWRLP